MSQDEVAAALDEIGTLLQLKGENDFRTRAYHGAARTMSQFSGDLKQLVADKKLDELPGIGDAMALKITTLVTTGKLKYLEDLRTTVPAGLIEMLRIPGLGPKKAKVLWDELNVDSIAKLQDACDSGEVAKLKGFGEKTQTKILEGIQFLGTVGNRVRFDQAFALGQTLLTQLRQLPGVIRSELCGSVRRRRETAKDVDIVVSSDDPQPIMDAFVKFPQVMQVVAHGPAKSSIVASVDWGGKKIVLNADLRVVTDEQFPVTLVHFTGSKDHNIQLRQRAIERGWSLNDFALTGEKGPFPIKDEEAVYKKLGLKWIPPEMREATGEIELAEAGTIPTLIQLSDLRGVFHNHTTASDGTATLEDMAKAAKKLGFEYFGVGDHSQSLTVANGLSPERVREQWAEIDALNKKLKGIRILKGTECDILGDGTLDFDDETLAGFEYVVASVHSLFALTEEEQTERICRALSHPAVTMLGHATGRLLLRREGYKLNIEQVLQTAAKHGKMIEINAQPDRLDLDWTHVKRAKALGIPLVINPDAHHPDELGLVAYGINVARRGWLTAADVFNTRSLAEVVKELARAQKVTLEQPEVTTMKKPAKSKSAKPATGGDDPIAAYSHSQTLTFRGICDRLRELIDTALPNATSKVWHGSPVWFINDNPVVGYNATAKAVSLLFWNGQAFDELDFKPVGKYRAAQALFRDAAEIDPKVVRRWLKKAKSDVFDSRAFFKKLRAGT